LVDGGVAEVVIECCCAVDIEGIWDEDVISHVLTDGGIVDDRGDSQRGEKVLISNTGELKKLRRVEGAS
jgi:hypothetical protein